MHPRSESPHTQFGEIRGEIEVGGDRGDNVSQLYSRILRFVGPLRRELIVVIVVVILVVVVESEGVCYNDLSPLLLLELAVGLPFVGSSIVALSSFVVDFCLEVPPFPFFSPDNFLSLFDVLALDCVLPVLPAVPAA